MDLQTRWDEAKSIASPDLWPDIEERSSMSRPQPRRERYLAASAAIAVAIGAGIFLLQAFDMFDDRGERDVVKPATSPSVTTGPCQFPPVKPATLPWLATGAQVPDPALNPLYQRATWEGPPGTNWAGAYVSVRVLTEATPSGTEPSPPLPDGSPGTLRQHLREWDVFWQSSERYCGSIALYVFLPNMSSAEARSQALSIADSMIEPTTASDSP